MMSDINLIKHFSTGYTINYLFSYCNISNITYDTELSIKIIAKDGIGLNNIKTNT